MLMDPFYWKKGWQKVVQRIRPTIHIESRLADLVQPLAPWRDSAAPTTKPLRIICATPQFDYGSRARGLSFEENNFVHTLWGMGHNVARFDVSTIHEKVGREKMGELLLEAAYRYNPDVIFFSLFKDEFSESTLQQLLDSGHRTLNWFSDDHWRFDTFSSRYAPFFSFVTTTVPSTVDAYRGLGAKPIVTQWAFNPFLYRKLPRKFRYDLSFVGQAYGKRKDFVAYLEANSVATNAFGFGWPAGKISQREMIQVFNESRINLNFSEASVPGRAQIKGRHFEIPGCGGLMLTDPAPGLHEFFDLDKECVVFHSKEELSEKVRWLLAHPTEAQAIADRGHERARREHTFVKRFMDIFSAAGLGG